MEIAELSPAEIDRMWLDAVSPHNAKLARANELANTAKKYQRFGGHYAEQGDRYQAEAEELRQEALAAKREADAPFLAEWERRGGWTRAYIVPDGHIHKETSCHTLYVTTIISWLPEQSGLSEDEIVELAGVHACTVCYPSAPVEELRAAEAAAKKAAQCPGSGEYAGPYNGRRYGRCPHCGSSVNVTSRGVLRAHKPKKVAA